MMRSDGKMERQFFSGNTVEQAVLAAARHYGLDPDHVAYRLRDKKHGFLNIRRRIVIEVDPQAAEQSEARVVAAEASPDIVDDEERERAKRAPGRPEQLFEVLQGEVGQQLPGEEGGQDGSSGDGNWQGEDISWAAGDHETDQEVQALGKAIQELGNLMGVKSISSIWREDDGFKVNLAGPDSRLLREHRGIGLDAIEQLLPRMARGLCGRGVPCRVDSEGFRAIHEEELKRLAKDTAEEVRRERETRRLEPMNPADRRLVHMALAEDSTVRTESEGAGFLKSVKVMPS